ncbi:ankyrin repeat domain-containing protein [Pedobacter fastidiosus]|uniref:Ankyrin repeat domain-containing protein n=1 Tax=Pedobacter fastidiosus TaxID=2765361 RepID=A0ABR7KXE3_9SPHI|nr:ankyrin repeat domain-containing protein [Pedobacter fastidiosus]MBC6112417.1 ankyrin repeat domain-containing protein [Pedobacter fastidiosus]
MSDQNLEQLLNSGNYPEALVQLTNGEKLPKTIQDFAKSQIFDNLFRNEEFEIIDNLIKTKAIEMDIYELDNFDKSIFQSVIRNLKDSNEGLDFFKSLISKFDNLNDEVEAKTLLGYFFEKGASLEKVKILVDAGCDVNFKNNAEENFIHQVVKTNLMKPDLSLSYLEFLINEGLDVNAPNIVKKTPLIAAIEFNREDYLDLLLENGANPNDIDKDGNSAFFYAVAHKLDLELYNKLRDYGTPDFDVQNRNQVTLLFEYIRMMYNSDDALKLLVKMIEDGADVYQTSIYYGKETTPLDLIAEKSAAVLEAVLETGNIDVNRQDAEGNTVLHKVCAYNVNYEADKAKETYRKVKLLIENGADISLTNDQDKTALMLASDDNLKIKTVELLMKQA